MQIDKFLTWFEILMLFILYYDGNGSWPTFEWIPLFINIYGPFTIEGSKNSYPHTSMPWLIIGKYHDVPPVMNEWKAMPILYHIVYCKFCYSIWFVWFVLSSAMVIMIFFSMECLILCLYLVGSVYFDKLREKNQKGIPFVLLLNIH